ncbi:GNAT family N-acetyltransferase [Microbacterium sp.]|uniref:GNAT family N-acetyltransferase n=1 Tax=Microbacterium sp. TaxID=51671 RepID=UPI003C794CE9
MNGLRTRRITVEDELRVGSGVVAMGGARIVAAVRWTVENGTVHIGRMTVAPDQQGKGLGTTLLRVAEHDSEATRAELFTGHLSWANIRLYVREGYAETRREALHDGVELVYLAKRLS